MFEQKRKKACALMVAMVMALCVAPMGLADDYTVEAIPQGQPSAASGSSQKETAQQESVIVVHQSGSDATSSATSDGENAVDGGGEIWYDNSSENLPFFLVNFYDQHGTLLGNAQMRMWDYLIEPDSSGLWEEGYQFLFWYDAQEEFLAPYAFGTPVEKDMDLFPYFVPAQDIGGYDVEEEFNAEEALALAIADVVASEVRTADVVPQTAPAPEQLLETIDVIETQPEAPAPQETESVISQSRDNELIDEIMSGVTATEQDFANLDTIESGVVMVGEEGQGSVMADQQADDLIHEIMGDMTQPEGDAQQDDSVKAAATDVEALIDLITEINMKNVAAREESTGETAADETQTEAGSEEENQIAGEVTDVTEGGEDQALTQTEGDEAEAAQTEGTEPDEAEASETVMSENAEADVPAGEEAGEATDVEETGGEAVTGGEIIDGELPAEDTMGEEALEETYDEDEELPLEESSEELSVGMLPPEEDWTEVVAPQEDEETDEESVSEGDLLTVEAIQPEDGEAEAAEPAPPQDAYETVSSEATTTLYALRDGERIPHGQQVSPGDTIVMEGYPNAPEGKSYRLQWERNAGSGWEAIEGETTSTYTFTLDEINYYWRFKLVMYTDMAPATESPEEEGETAMEEGAVVVEEASQDGEAYTVEVIEQAPEGGDE